MVNMYIILLWAVALIASKWIYEKTRKRLAFRAAQRQYGAAKAPRYPHRDPWGYDLYKERLEATKQGHTFRLYDKQYEQLGHTWEEQFFNTKVINTMDRTNIQHIAALKFDDFGVSNRKNPLMGDGIFSSDGPKWKFSRDLIKPTFLKSEVGDVKQMDVHVNRLFDLIPRDGSTVDMQPLLKRLVRSI